MSRQCVNALKQRVVRDAANSVSSVASILFSAPLRCAMHCPSLGLPLNSTRVLFVGISCLVKAAFSSVWSSFYRLSSLLNCLLQLSGSSFPHPASRTVFFPLG